MEKLRVTIVQSNPAWEDKETNLVNLDRIFGLIGTTDLVLLPEMFTTGFSMQTEKLAETMEGSTVRWMSNKSLATGAVIAGSIVIEENEKYYNRMVWATPDGGVHWYDKRHLFSIGEEHLNFSPGQQRVTFQWNGWKCRLLVCYDLRFPVWSRNDDDYDLLINVANWPSARHNVWKSLLIARALENQCYCIGVNRTGSDGMGLTYLGDSGIISPRGDAEWLGSEETYKTFTLSLQELHAFREKFPILRDRDIFYIETGAGLSKVR